jgi:hypothetical protein
MCYACDPEPLDEQPGGTAETRGGDRLADISVQLPLFPVPDPENAVVTGEDEEE